MRRSVIIFCNTHRVTGSIGRFSLSCRLVIRHSECTVDWLLSLPSTTLLLLRDRVTFSLQSLLQQRDQTFTRTPWISLVDIWFDSVRSRTNWPTRKLAEIHLEIDGTSLRELVTFVQGHASVMSLVRHTACLRGPRNAYTHTRMFECSFGLARGLYDV